MATTTSRARAKAMGNAPSGSSTQLPKNPPSIGGQDSDNEFETPHRSKSPSDKAYSNDGSYQTTKGYQRPDSLFGEENEPGTYASFDDVISEMNNTANKRGKGPIPLHGFRRFSNTQSAQDDEQRPEHGTKTRETRSQSPLSTGTNISQITQSRVQAYHADLRRRFVLQTLRDQDLLTHSTTLIEDQGVYMDENDMVYHIRHPKIKQPARPIEDIEIAVQRSIYPEPFSEDDPVQQRRPQKSSSNHSTPVEDDAPPHKEGDPDKDKADKPKQPQKKTPPQKSGGRHPTDNRRKFTRPSNRQNQGPPSDDGDPPRDSDPDNGPDSSGTPSQSENEDDLQEQQDRAPRSTKSPNPQGEKPSVFGRTRFSSADPTFNEKQVYTYDPTPQSDEELLRAAFKTFEDLIVSYLHCPSTKGRNNNVQKTLLANIPKPGLYSGEDDFTVFENFIRDQVRWQNTADLCGPEVRWSKSRRSYVLTSVDLQRSNTLAAFLKGAARQWYVEVVERIPDDFDRDDPLKGRWTFMQVVSGLYRRFIHDASITKVAEKLESVTYTKSGGIEGLFSTMKRYARSMPIPPDVYSFKKRLLLTLPPSMAMDMTKIHGVNAERSTVNDIMQAGIACERNDRFGRYYAEARAQLERARRRRSRTRSRSRSRERRKSKQNGDYRRSGSPKRLQVVDGRRYSVKPHSKNSHEDTPRFTYKSNSSNNKNEFKPKYDRKDGRNKPFVKPDYPNNASGTSNREPVRPGQVFTMVDNDGVNRLCRILEVDDPSANQSSGESAQSNGDSPTDDDIWSRYVDDRSDTAPTGEESRSSSPEPYGGSQYTSDDEGSERFGMAYADSEYESDVEEYTLGTYPERLARMGSDVEYESATSYYSCEESDDESEVYNLDFPEYLRTMNVNKDGSVTATLEPKRVKAPNVGKRPRRKASENRCLAAWIEIDGVRAFVLFDSGSTADAVSPDFARTAKLKLYRLESPVTLQLGTKGSRSRITYGCTAKYKIPGSKTPIESRDYFDIANIDRYDAVVGTVFMRRHGIVLDFGTDTIRVKGQTIPTLSEGEELTELARRAAKRVQSDNIQLKDNEEIEVRARPNKYGVKKTPVPQAELKQNN
ncbi:hypothetical protein VNI00_017272 [Paramarasmius palmivorus]|uniref:Uncharacterized protein n=1 Tax=Paramarasmius palmivorus TaxID=297713 RepID=A0AAW0B9M1_9AGAR